MTNDLNENASAAAKIIGDKFFKSPAQTYVDKIEADLCAEFKAWCEANGLEHRSADEYLHDEELSAAQQAYVKHFCARWNAWEELDRDLHKSKEDMILGAAVENAQPTIDAEDILEICEVLRERIGASQDDLKANTYGADDTRAITGVIDEWQKLIARLEAMPTSAYGGLVKASKQALFAMEAVYNLQGVEAMLPYIQPLKAALPQTETAGA